jgi:hypothetical protein
MSQEQVKQQAQAMLNSMCNDIFFNKLASLGIEPDNEQEAAQLLQLGQSLLGQYPRGEAGTHVKQACYGDDAASAVASNGVAVEAYQALDYVYKTQPNLVKAAEILMN